MFRWGGRYLNSVPFQTGFAVHTILQGSDQAMSQTSSSISGTCNKFTLQLCAVSERMGEHVLNGAQISPRVSEAPWLVFSVWKHWMMKSRHWMVLHSHSISFSRLTVWSLWMLAEQKLWKRVHQVENNRMFYDAWYWWTVRKFFSTHANFLNRAWLMGIKTIGVCADLWK